MKNNYKKNKNTNSTNRKFKKTENFDQKESFSSKESVSHYDKQILTSHFSITQYHVETGTQRKITPSLLLPEPPTAHNINTPRTSGLSKTYQRQLSQGGKISIHIKSFDQLSPLEIYNILKIRQDTFMIEQKIIYEDIDGKDPHCIHIWCQEEKSHDFLAYLRIVPIKEAKQVSIGRVLTIQAARGQGIARELMKKGIKFIRSHYTDYLLTLSAKEKLCPFYETLGFTKTGKPFFYPKNDSTPIFPMVYAGHTKKVLSFTPKTPKKKWA